MWRQDVPTRVVLALVIIAVSLALGDGDPTVELEPLGHDQWMDAVEDAFHIDPTAGPGWRQRQQSTSAFTPKLFSIHSTWK